MNYDDALKTMDDIDRLFKVLDFKDKKPIFRGHSVYYRNDRM